ncbi:TlpA disulfide reductase family protein [Deferribacter thermophilus]|uniref:TlpA family protein disulfide reductase n=1 Tax=Deferribacter thermophilus TaxID=53573 RepID=UPI003C233FDE
MKKFIFLFIFLLFVINSYSLTVLSVADYKDLIKRQNTKVIVLFWASYCPFCKKEIKNLSKNIAIFDKYKTKIILVSIDKRLEDALQSYKALNVEFPLYLASKDLIDHLNVRLVPITATYNKMGELIDIAPGYKTVDEILEMLED